MFQFPMWALPDREGDCEVENAMKFHQFYGHEDPDFFSCASREFQLCNNKIEVITCFLFLPISVQL